MDIAEIKTNEIQIKTVASSRSQKKFVVASTNSEGLESTAVRSSDVDYMEYDEMDRKASVCLEDTTQYPLPSERPVEHYEYLAASTACLNGLIETASDVSNVVSTLATSTQLMNTSSFSHLANESPTPHAAHSSGEVLQLAELSAHKSATGNLPQSQSLARSPTGVPVTFSRAISIATTRMPYQAKPAPTPKVIIVSGTGLSTATTINAPPPTVTIAVSSVTTKSSPIKSSAPLKSASDVSVADISRVTSKSSALMTATATTGESRYAFWNKTLKC